MSEHTQIVKRIGVAKLLLWMEAERIESYPEAFSKLDPNGVYTKKTLAADALGLVSKGSGKFVRGDFLNNLFGLEIESEEKVLIRGINALEEVSPGLYKPSAKAIAIGQAYAQKDTTSWLYEFAKMVACYEIRTRLLLFLLGKGGGVLSFPSSEFFGSRSNHAILTGIGSDIAIFADNYNQFNQLLQEHRWVALGSWWEKEIRKCDLQIDHNFNFEGLREVTPPTNWLNTRLKISLFLMKHLGVLESRAGGWAVNPVQATTIFGEDIAQDFVEVEFDRTPLQHLQEWQATLKDEVGFVTVADLVEQWKKYQMLSIAKAEVEFDGWMRQQVYLGRVRILETHAGQPRLGRGLFGDDTARKIRFEVMEA